MKEKIENEVRLVANETGAGGRGGGDENLFSFEVVASNTDPIFFQRDSLWVLVLFLSGQSVIIGNSSGTLLNDDFPLGERGSCPS